MSATTPVPAVQAEMIHLTIRFGVPAGLNDRPQANGMRQRGANKVQARTVTQRSQSSTEQLISGCDASVRITTYHTAVNVKETTAFCP